VLVSGLTLGGREQAAAGLLARAETALDRLSMRRPRPARTDNHIHMQQMGQSERCANGGGQVGERRTHRGADAARGVCRGLCPPLRSRLITFGGTYGKAALFRPASMAFGLIGSSPWLVGSVVRLYSRIAACAPAVVASSEEMRQWPRRVRMAALCVRRAAAARSFSRGCANIGPHGALLQTARTTFRSTHVQQVRVRQVGRRPLFAAAGRRDGQVERSSDESPCPLVTTKYGWIYMKQTQW
jgi:hypothetical protein